MNGFARGGLAALALACSVSAQELLAPGTESFAGLGLHPSARLAGLAGASAAVAAGPDAVGTNPAGLLRDAGRYRYAGSLRAHPAGAAAGSVAYARPAGSQGHFALGASYLDYGTVDGMDELGNPTGGIRPASFYPSLSYARSVDAWRLGATVKLAYEYLGDFEGSQAAAGLGADVGVQYQPSARNLGFGAACLNLGRKVAGHFAGDAGSGSFPTLLRAGMFYHPQGPNQMITADLELPLHGAPRLALGAEYRMAPAWDLRAGTRWDANDVRNLLGWIDAVESEERYGGALKASAGTTLRLGAADVDYAVQWWRTLGLAHALTVSWSVGGAGSSGI